MVEESYTRPIAVYWEKEKEKEKKKTILKVPRGDRREKTGNPIYDDVYPTNMGCGVGARVVCGVDVSPQLKEAGCRTCSRLVTHLYYYLVYLVIFLAAGLKNYSGVSDNVGSSGDRSNQ